MRILLVSAMFPPIHTGTSFYSKNLANALMDRQNEVVVVTVRNPRASRDNEPFSVHRLKALYVPLRKLFKHFRLTSIFPSNYTGLEQIARDFRAEVILLVNHYLDIAFPAIFVSQRLGIPLACSVGTQLQSSNPRREWLLNMLDRVICGNLIFPFCKKIIAWDRQVMQYLSDVHGPKVINKTSIVNFGPNGDVGSFLSHQHDYDLHNQVLGVGAVTEQRDFTALVRGFGLIANEYPGLKLKIVGHVYYDKAVRLAADLALSGRVIFTGEWPHERVLKEFKLSDLYFVSLSGKYLGLGTATIEAMLTGVPVMANAPLDLLGTAVLRDMEDIVQLDGLVPRAIASKMGQLLGDRGLREKIGRGGRRFVQRYLNWDRVARDMEMLLTRVVQET